MQVLLAIQDASGTVVLCDASRTMKPPCFHPVNALEEFSDGGFEAQVLGAFFALGSGWIGGGLGLG